MNPATVPKQNPLTCQLFCRVIDNFGDIGVCWRLARQLVAEHQIALTLWLDDMQALAALLTPHEQAQLAALQNEPGSTLILAGVQIRHWSEPFHSDLSQLSADMVIEAFACELPVAFKEHLQQLNPAPLWINLDYLSAETWVQDCHGLPSIDARTGMRKFFFFPGFTARTGGLLRERDLLARHTQWQTDERRQRQRLLADLGLPPADIARLQIDGSLLISIFTYETAALNSWFEVLSSHAAPVLCLIPEGRVLNSAPAGLRRTGERWQQGNLTVQVIPFTSQDDYDRLLSICDLNLVRGEDSFVRAQWAARPLLWHIYAQEGGVHLDKLQAFVDLCWEGPEASAGLRSVVWAFWLDWNQGRDCAQSGAAFLQALAQLHSHARQWQQKLAGLHDTASNLVKFYENRPGNKL